MQHRVWFHRLIQSQIWFVEYSKTWCSLHKLCYKPWNPIWDTPIVHLICIVHIAYWWGSSEVNSSRCYLKIKGTNRGFVEDIILKQNHTKCLFHQISDLLVENCRLIVFSIRWCDFCKCFLNVVSFDYLYVYIDGLFV